MRPILDLLSLLVWAVAQVIMAVAAVLRNVPGLSRAILSALRVVMVVSFHLYRYLLTQLAQPAAHLRISLLRGNARVVACATLSVALGCGAMWLLGWSITPIAVGVMILHGAWVGVVWQGFVATNPLDLGGRI